MKILYLPLDERPCNWFYPQMIAQLQSSLTLLVPPQSLLGQKKRPAHHEHLWAWLTESIQDCQTAILSLEMLVYGGLLPSRLHQDSVDDLLERLNQLRSLKAQHPQLTLLASNLVMRTPSYASSEEEPDYYEEWGDRIFRYGWLLDKRTRAQQREPSQSSPALNDTEVAEFERIKAELPEQYLSDYRQRRAKNLQVNLTALTLVQDGIIDFLSIPQDDSAPYGFTALDQQPIVQQIAQQRLQRQVMLYPGADEVGCTLLARAYGQAQGISPRFYPLYSSVSGEQRIPLYEDRPLGESLRSHLQAAGAQLAQTPAEADIILAVNTAGPVMQEAWDQPIKDLTYTTHRNLNFFVAQIEQFLQAGQAVAVADVAFANGGETALVELLDDSAAWDQLLAYAGWNTSCNTIGTVLATAILGWDVQASVSASSKSDVIELDVIEPYSGNEEAIAFNKIHHLLEDWAYQSEVRMPMVREFLPTIGASYYEFDKQDEVIHRAMQQRILECWQKTLLHSFQDWSIEQLKVSTPWNRMFEIAMELAIAPLR